MNTHKQSPQQIARAVLADNEEQVLKGDMTLESMIMLGIAAYTDESNQRPENLSEVCRRLGVSLHWMDRRDLQYIGELSTNARFELYVGLARPYVATTDERELLAELEQVMPIADRAGIAVWVRAAG